MTRRARRRLEAGAALAAFPVAVALTVAAIATPGTDAGPAGATTASGVLVEVEAEDPLEAYAVAERLAAGGYDVVGVGANPNSVSPTTVVVYYEREHQPAAARLRDLLGGGTIRREQVLNRGSDLTVLLGKDPQRT